MSFLSGQAVRTSSEPPAPVAAVIAGAIVDADNANIQLDYAGSQLGDATPADFGVAVFTVEFIARDVVQTDSIGPQATLLPRGGSPASFRIGSLSLAPGGVTLTPDAGFTDAGDQAAIEAAFTWSGGVLSFAKQVIADILAGLTGSLTNWLDGANFQGIECPFTSGSPAPTLSL